jgi:hypothetical protein
MDPLIALRQNGSPVLLLIGSTREENAGINDDPTVTPALDEAGSEASVHAEYDPLGAGVANQILALYPASSYDAPTYALIAVDSDSLLTCPTRETARAAAGASRPAVWRYLYIHRYENNATLNLLHANRSRGHVRRPNDGLLDAVRCNGQPQRRWRGPVASV